MSLKYLMDENVNPLYAIQIRRKNSELIIRSVGENEATISDLDMLQNTKERTTTYYSRLYTLSLRIAEAQPKASVAMMELLDKTLNEAEAISYASRATIEEIKRDWNLL